MFHHINNILFLTYMNDLKKIEFNYVKIIYVMFCFLYHVIISCFIFELFQKMYFAIPLYLYLILMCYIIISVIKDAFIDKRC